uniref:Uncharacterized protein LOC108949427 n=1 Tax=Phallusia mammillata TaxID=59560 RepID=A0A6F9DIF8_9ASCI|nr:uncharacterized protein LOC108949427 [Phallusia mammillata]
MSVEKARESLKRKIEDDVIEVTPSTLVFVRAKQIDGKFENIRFQACHVEEITAEVEPRVMDKLKLSFDGRLFDKNAAAQIVGFLNLQAPPLCLLVKPHNLSQLKELKRSLDSWNVVLPTHVWYALLEFNTIHNNVLSPKRSNTPQPPATAKNSGQDISLAQKVVKKLNRLSFRRFSDLTYEDLPVLPPTISTMPSDDTVVFLDLETTDLYAKRITEICLIAVPRQSILNNPRGAKIDSIDLLKLVVDPEYRISPTASELTKLTCENISRSEKVAFDERVATAVCNFLCRIPGKVCLVAHAGNRFDFKVLRAHLQPYKQLEELIKHVQCYDTMLGFKRMKMPCRLRMQDLYAHCFDGAEIPNSHSAEGDATALLELVAFHPGVLSTAKKHKLIKPYVEKRPKTQWFDEMMW